MRHPHPSPPVCTGQPSDSPTDKTTDQPTTDRATGQADTGAVDLASVDTQTAEVPPIELVVRTARTRFFASEPEELARQEKQNRAGAEDCSQEGKAKSPDSQEPPPHTEPEAPSSPINLGVLIDGALTDLSPQPPDITPTPRRRRLNLKPFQPVRPVAELSQPAQQPPAATDPVPGTLSPEEHTRAEQELAASLTGLGPLHPLLTIPNITDIFVVPTRPADTGNGTDPVPCVWYEADGTLHRSDITLAGEDEVRALATRLILAAGGRLDDAYPCADAQTTEGQRIHAVLPPLSKGGTTLSIRLQSTLRPTLTDLAAKGMMGSEISTLLQHIVDSRANFLISGGTGTGKTTLLAALLDETASTDRLVLVEDTAELRPRHRHTVSLQARTPNAEGRGGVSLTNLIRTALRMRPTRLVVGECRGAEIADMLTAMNTGHSGTGGTLHANSASAVPARLYALGALAGLSERALTLQAATALDYVVHIEREGPRRLVREVARLVERSGRLEVEPLCRVEPGRRGDCLTWFPEGQDLYERIAQADHQGQE